MNPNREITEAQAIELWVQQCPDECCGKDMYIEALEDMRHIEWAEYQGYTVKEDAK